MISGSDIVLRWRASPERPGEYICVRADQAEVFEPQLFDDHWLQAQGRVVGRPAGGRGEALFVEYGNQSLVLRHYRRGGAIRQVVRERYVWCGRSRTRVAREMAILLRLEHSQVPVGRAFAGRIQHRGVFYRCSLLTHRAAGHTLAHLIGTRPGAVSIRQWQAMGRSIARLHEAGVWHADLNAHNLLLDGEHATLIDFDQACWYGPQVLSATRRQANLDRLRRSLGKLAGELDQPLDEPGWQALVAASSASTRSR